jgi:hypothetical protein
MERKNKLNPSKFAKIPEASEQEERRKSHLTSALDLIDEQTPVHEGNQELEESNLFGDISIRDGDLLDKDI